ncbi:MAG: hypothetical protein HY721_30720, partial [Planctomycetes bacterium]|nr:hypothetical protein [Planctomycetota bacterium]
GTDVRLGRVLWRAAPDREALLEALRGLRMGRLGEVAGLEVLRQKPGRFWGRLRTAGGDYFVKGRRLDRFRRLFRSLLRPSPMREEWRKAWWLRSRGVATPEPVAVGEVRRLGALVESYYVCRWLPGALSLRAYLDEKERALGPRELARLRARLTRLLGGLLGELHAHRAYHWEFHDTNILVEEPEGGAPRLVLIDLDHLQVRERFTEEDRAWSLHQVAWYLRKPLARWPPGIRGVLRFLRGYHEADPASAPTFRALVEKVLPWLPAEPPASRPRRRRFRAA